MKQRKVPIRYVPSTLSNKDRSAQIRMLNLSKRLYKKHRYFTRRQLPSYHNRTSKHILHARRLYGVDKVVPNKQLASATGCSVAAMKKIVNKGAGAYFSSGSRPNQTAQSWGIARLASSLTGGKSAAVDYDILYRGCDHTKRAFRLANQSRRRFGHGQSSSKKTTIST
jgi:hypothetical protein